MSRMPPESLESSTQLAPSTPTVGFTEGTLSGETPDAPQHIGDYTILRVLGEGGMGTVYLAEDKRLGRRAAVKTMNRQMAEKPENRVRFAREARAAAAVEHDNIVPIWQVGESADGSPFIAMPFLQGESLEDRIRRQPVQPLGVVLKVAREIAEGLAAAHARKLIHRDIKPANIWVEGDPSARELAGQVRRCKILDFGLARCRDAEDVQVTASGAIMGTPAYMAPEQACGQPLDHRADLFSLGALLYRLTTGKLPFQGANTMAVLTALATTTPPPARSVNPNVPQSLSDLIARLMSKDPAGRPQSAAEVVVTVRQILQELQKRKSASTTGAATTSVNAPEPVPPVRPKKPQRNRTPLIVAFCLLVLVPLAGWLATVVLRVETAEGTLVLEMDDAEVEARVKGGKLVLVGPDDKTRYTLAPSERNKQLDAGKYRIRVEGADGLTLDTHEFTMKKGEKITVRVTMVPKSVANGDGPDRKAADLEAWLKNVTDLPSQRKIEAFKAKMRERNPGFDGQVTYKISDGDVVTELRFVTDNVTDIAPVRAFKGLQLLECSGSSFTWIQGVRRGAGQLADLTPLRGMNWTNLTSLDLRWTQVGDAELALFQGCTNLTTLFLSGTKVTDAGLAHFKGCKNLQVLYLPRTQVTDAGLGHFADCKNLKFLVLEHTQVTDAGLAHLAGCKNLIQFDLAGTQVTDAGLIHFADCTHLMNIKLQNTKVTDAGMVHLQGRTRLTSLDLARTQVSDAGLTHFKDCKNLMDLGLGGKQMTVAGLANFKDCKNLTNLWLFDMPVTAASLARFKDCEKLASLSLQYTQVPDEALVHFQGSRSLTHLHLRNTPTTDLGLSTFQNCKNLTNVILVDTKVTEKGVEELRKALPGCRIEWNTRIIEPAGK